MPSLPPKTSKGQTALLDFFDATSPSGLTPCGEWILTGPDGQPRGWYTADELVPLETPIVVRVRLASGSTWSGIGPGDVAKAAVKFSVPARKAKGDNFTWLIRFNPSYGSPEVIVTGDGQGTWVVESDPAADDQSGIHNNFAQQTDREFCSMPFRWVVTR